MTTFVILAAGRGTRIGRVGDFLHKALVPLDNRAVLSHLIDLAPPDARIIVCAGHRAAQIREYVALAHPTVGMTIIDVPGWDQPGAGPGASLLAARSFVTGDLVFTSCDTLWARDRELWRGARSWAAVAPMPAGTQPERWCRMRVSSDDRVSAILDKTPGTADLAYVGLARVVASDLDVFWNGVTGGDLVENERQVTGGFQSLIAFDRLDARRIDWTDVGDDAAYRRAVARRSGYDWTKPGQATYILPEEGRVVKCWADASIAKKRRARALDLRGLIPTTIGGPTMLAYDYVPGRSGYAAAEHEGAAVMTRVLAWLGRHRPVYDVPDAERIAAGLTFYRDKTLQRCAQLRPELAQVACDAVKNIAWDTLTAGVEPSHFHGDCNLGNVIVTITGQVLGLDWREDFAGQSWGDRRYDYAKLLAGCVVHWDRAQRGDFREWPEGKTLYDAVDARCNGATRTIAALSLINSAPLHAAPLDEVLVARGAAWLEQLT